MLKNLFIKYKEIIMYLIMGVATTAVSWVTYGASVSIINVGSEITNIFIANIIAWILAVAFAYITNKIFVFESRSWKPAFVLKECALFVSSRLATGVLEIVAVPFLVKLGLDQKVFGIDGMFSKVLVSVLVVILNYVFSKLFVFKDNKEEVSQ